MTDTAPSILEPFGAAFLRLHDALGDSAEAQWQKGATPRAVDDTTERSKGTTSDPVVSTFYDGRRLNLRAAVLKGEKALADGLAAMHEAIAVLERAKGNKGN